MNKKKLLAVDEETYRLVTKDCLKELIRHHPEFIKVPISHNKIVYHIAKYYIDEA